MLGQGLPSEKPQKYYHMYLILEREKVDKNSLRDTYFLLIKNPNLGSSVLVWTAALLLAK